MPSARPRKRDLYRHAVPRPIATALLLSAVIVFASAWIAQTNIEGIVGSGEVLMQSGDVLDAATRLRGALHAAETGQRGYLLTGDRRSLEPYLRAKPLA